MKLKIIKNKKKDYLKKNILYPKFKAKTMFEGVKLEFSKYDSHTRIGLNFKEKIKTPENRRFYGMDFTSSDGSSIILRYKINNKGVPIVNSIEII